VSFAGQAQAGIIYSSFGPGNAFTWNSGVYLYHSAVLASEFTSTGNYDVTQIDLAVGNAKGDNGAVVSLWTLSAYLPGTELGSWTLTGLPSSSAAETISTISGISGVSLAAGSYFLEVAPLDSTTVDYLSVGNPGTAGAYYYLSSFTYGELPAFDVIGNTAAAVPEPSSLLLFLSGLAALAGLAFGARSPRCAVGSLENFCR
jgi:hypothetical protein